MVQQEICCNAVSLNAARYPSGKRIDMSTTFTTPWLGLPLIPRAGLFLCLSLALYSCSISRHPAVIASSTAPITSAYTVTGSVESSSCSHWLLYIPISGKGATEEIIDSLIKENGADALVGLTVEHMRSTFVLPLAGSDCSVVKGLAVRSARQ